MITILNMHSNTNEVVMITILNIISTLEMYWIIACQSIVTEGVAMSKFLFKCSSILANYLEGTYFRYN